MTAETVIEAFFAALQRGDAEAVAALYADDLAVWHSNDGVTQGKAENLRTLAWMIRTAEPRYTVLERLVDGGRVAQRHRLELVSRDGKARWTGEAAIFFEVREGLIRRIDEYIDSDAVRGLLQAIAG